MLRHWELKRLLILVIFNNLLTFDAKCQESAVSVTPGPMPALLVIPICFLGNVTYINTIDRFKLEHWSFSLLFLKEEVQHNNKS